jgi:acetyl esterase/lipase
MNRQIGVIYLSLFLTTSLVSGQQPSLPTDAASAANRDTSYIDAQGTAHVTRVVPLPQTVSNEARRYLARQISDQAVSESMADRRAHADVLARSQAEGWKKLCAVSITEQKIADVPVRVVTPDTMPEASRDKVLINLHGGGFNSDAGSLPESIPIAGFSGMKVVAVLYRLDPENHYPAQVEDAIAVYKELLKSYAPEHIAIYGTSAGAVITGQVAVHLKHLGLPEPGALGIFSGHGDFACIGDTQSLFGIPGLSGHLNPPREVPHTSDYLQDADPHDPQVSALYSDLHGMPPTLFVSSGRDVLQSGTTILHRAFLDAGVDARLIVFEGLPHAFWYDSSLPESVEANRDMATFFVHQLSR